VGDVRLHDTGFGGASTRLPPPPQPTLARPVRLQEALHGPLRRPHVDLHATQHGVTASAGQRRGDVEIRSFLQDAAGRRSLVFDLSITHDRIGSSCHVQQNGLLSHPQDLDAPLRLAAQRKINRDRQQYADNQNISFLPAIVTTFSRMHGEFLRLLFYRPTARPRRTSMPLGCLRNKTDRTTRSGSNTRHSTWA
jgi:hypothetical protein